MAEKTVRTDVRTDPELKAAFAAFCEGKGVTVSEQTRNFWKRALQGDWSDGHEQWQTEDEQKEPA